MSSTMIAVVIVAISVLIFIPLTLRRLNNTPGYKELMKVPFKERMRLGKLARSQTYITNREDSRKAEELSRASKRMIDHQLSPRHVAILAAVLVLPRFIGGVDRREIFIFGGLLVVLIGGYLWHRKTTAAIKRTAEINGWNLEDPGTP